MGPVNQYDIVLVNLDPTVGSEMKKTRACLVLSPDEMNHHLQTIVIAPMTSTSKAYPTRVKVKCQQKDGWVVIDQMRTVDRARIVKSYHRLSEKEVKAVKSVIRETFVD